MKIGVLSDTHMRTMSPELAKVLLNYFQGVNMILHAGDVVEMVVLDIFQSYELYVVAGNMDSLEIKEMNPWKRVLNVGNFKIGMIHGWGSPSGMEQRVQREFEDVDCIIFGHTHNPCNRRIGKTLFFNPGSPTDKRFARVNSFGILEVNNELTGEIIYL